MLMLMLYTKLLSGVKRCVRYQKFCLRWLLAWYCPLDIVANCAMKYIHHTMTAIITPVYTAHSKFIEFLHPPSKTWSLLSLRFAQGRKDAIGNIYYFNFLKHVCAFQQLCSTQNLITYIIMFDKKKIMNTLTTNRIFENSLQFAYSFRLNSTDFKNRRAGEHLS